MVHEIDYAGAVRRHWTLAVGVFAVTVITAIIVTGLQTPVYESSAQLIVAPAAATADPTDAIRSLETLERRTVVATFARMAATDDTHRLSTQAVKLSEADAEKFDVHGSVVPNTNIIRIDVRGPDPAIAAVLANTAAELTARQAEALYRVYTLRFLARASAPPSPVSPDWQRNLLVGSALALFLALVAVLAAERIQGGRQP